MNRFVEDLPDVPIVLSVGAQAHGFVVPEYTERTLKISNYNLSASVCLARICNSFETKWAIL